MNMTIDIGDSYHLSMGADCLPRFINILQNTVWGSQGILYIMNDLELEMSTFTEPIFVTLFFHEEPLAICLFNRKLARVKGEVIPCYYLCLLTVLEHARGKGLGRLMVEEATRIILNHEEDALVYAYVEEENEYSYRLFKSAGFHRLGGFIVAIHNRFTPKRSPYVNELTLQEKPVVFSMIEAEYQDHDLFDLDLSLDKHCFIYRREGEIVAGLQAKPMSWRLVSLPGIQGYLLSVVFPRISLLKKRLDPDAYRFIKIGDVLLKKGFEKEFKALLSDVMARYNVSTCMFYASSSSEPQQRIAKVMHSGLLSSIDAKAVVFAKSFALDHGTSPLDALYISNADAV